MWLYLACILLISNSIAEPVAGYQSQQAWGSKSDAIASMEEIPAADANSQTTTMSAFDPAHGNGVASGSTTNAALAQNGENEVSDGNSHIFATESAYEKYYLNKEGKVG